MSVNIAGSRRFVGSSPTSYNAKSLGQKVTRKSRQAKQVTVNDPPVTRSPISNVYTLILLILQILWQLNIMVHQINSGPSRKVLWYIYYLGISNFGLLQQPYQIRQIIMLEILYHTSGSIQAFLDCKVSFLIPATLQTVNLSTLYILINSL